MRSKTFINTINTPNQFTPDTLSVSLNKTKDLKKSNSADSKTPFTPSVQASAASSLTAEVVLQETPTVPALAAARLTAEVVLQKNPIVAAVASDLTTISAAPGNADIRLPTALQWLTQHMKDLDVVGLMALAKRQGKQLQDVLTAKMEVLKAGLATGKIKNLWGYLAHLLKVEIDYSWLVKRADAKQEENEKAQKEKEEFEQLKKKHAGKSYRNANGTEFNVLSNGLFCYIKRLTEKQERCQPVDIDLIRALENFMEIKKV